MKMIQILCLLLVLIQGESHRIPFNSNDPDYFAQSGVGGLPQSSGGDGSVVIVTKQPTELRSSFFFTGSPQSYAVPGDRRHPYEQRVYVKLWGAGGGGCDGGRVAALSESDDDLSSGSAGEYVHASFILPIGEALIVDVGGGGQSRSKGSRSQTLLGGLGGYNGGKSGFRDRSSEGGGGGGISKISFSNGTIIAAAFGGNGGGNTTYCTALGGQGGRLRGINSGGFINSEIALVDDNTEEDTFPSSTILATHEDKDEARPLLNNQWIPVTITQEAVTISEANTTNDATSWCEHSSHRPTGRRGHSMTAVNDHVYIFGGVTSKCLCNVTNGEKKCFSTNVYSNELWHFDVPSATFTLLESSGENTPQGREQHSATIMPNGDIIIIGGLSSSDETITKDFQALNEVWRLADPHRITTHVISGLNSSNTTLPMQLNQSSLPSHTVNIDLDDDMCVEDLQLSLSLDHGCPQGIEYISLTSPSVSSGQNSSQRRQLQNKLFVSTAENRERECTPSLFNLSFSDTAEESVLSYSALPRDGSYIPATFFRSSPASGEWTLKISTSQRLVEFNATLHKWELHMQTKSCTPRVKWEQMSVPSSFEPRYGHTAIVVDSDSIFISGGMNHRRLNDLWRLNYLSNTWTQLNAPALQNNPTIQRQEVVVGPWSLLQYGGMKARSGALSRGRDLSIQNLFTDEWQKVSLSNPEAEGKLGPHGRYLTSVALINSADVIHRLHNIDGPFLLMFGGDRGHSINAYPNSYGFMPNTFLDDVWILSLSELKTHHVMNRNDYCIGRLDRGSTHYQIWNASCGWEASVGGEPAVCESKEILIMAWCQQRYQHFHTY